MLEWNTPKQWDMTLAQAEFVFNNTKNITIGKCLFNVVYTKAPRLTFDIANLPTGVDIHNEAEEMANRVQKLHKEVYNH